MSTEQIYRKYKYLHLSFLISSLKHEEPIRAQGQLKWSVN